MVALKWGGFAGVKRGHGKYVRFCWALNRHVRESRRHAVGDDGAEIAEACECMERALFVL
jgi:hypothetical protein